MSVYRVVDRRIDPFFKVQNVIFDQYASALGTIGLAVYCALCRRAGGDPEAWPSLRDLSALTGAGATAIRDAIIRIELCGLVEVGIRIDPIEGQKGNIYTLLEPSPNGPPAQWAKGFPKNASEYRNLPRPVRELTELPARALRKKTASTTPTPPPSRGGGATVWRWGGHRSAAGGPPRSGGPSIP